jgi:beta-lactamase regulating signal transducer with metallopeptidase domain
MGLITQISAMAAGSLVSAVWEGLVLAACVAICLRLLPGISAAARSLVWSAVMLAVVLLPFAHFSGAAVASARQVHVDERVSLVLAAVWAVFSLFRAVELIRSAVWLRGVARRATPVTVEPGVAALLGDTPRVVVCGSEEVDRPSVVGFFAPKILLPEVLLAKLSQPELEQIVLHEMEHLRRADDWTNLLQKLSLVLFPLNPVLVWIERRLCLERELACDDRVLRATNARKAYAACLANLAEHSLVRRGVSLALGAWERQSELVRRVHRILLRPDREMGRRPAAVAVGLMLAGLVGGADALAHSPQLVSFGPAAAGVPMAEVAHSEGAFVPVVEESVSQRLKPTRGNGGYATAEAVAFPERNGAAGARMTLARAVMPPAPRTLPAKRPVRKAAGVKQARPVAPQPSMARLISFEQTPQNQPQQDAPPQTMVVLLTWRAVTPAVQSSQFSYAAVPVRNGWLFVQL